MRAEATHSTTLPRHNKIGRDADDVRTMMLILISEAISNSSAVIRPQFRKLRFRMIDDTSWLNLVERWFGKLTDKRIRRGTFFSVQELERAIQEYLEETNKQPKPFIWTATVEQILAKVNRCKAILETQH